MRKRNVALLEMIGGKMYFAPLAANKSSAFVAIDSTIYRMTQKLNKIHDFYEPSAHTIHCMLNYACSDSMLLVFNKKRIILFNTQSKEIVSYCDYPENALYVSAVSSQHGTYVCLRQESEFVIYRFEDNELVEFFAETYNEIAVFQTKPSVRLAFWGAELLVSTGNEILVFRNTGNCTPQRYQQSGKVTALHIAGDYVCVGLGSGIIQVFKGSFNESPLFLNFHHYAVTEITSLPCDVGRPILFSADFSQKIAKWVPQRNGYKRIVIGPLLSCCYNLVEPHDCQYLYAQLDCNKIVVFDVLSTREEFVLSSCPYGRNTISRPIFFTPKIRNARLMFESVPGSLEIVQTVFAPFFTSEIINLYNGYSNSDMICNLLMAQGYLPQIKFFDILQKNKIVALLECNNPRFENTQLIIADFQGSVLFEIDNIVPGSASGLYINEREIYVCVEQGYLKLQLDGDQLIEQGFFAWMAGGSLDGIQSISDGKLTVVSGQNQHVCEEFEHRISVLSTAERPRTQLPNDVPDFMEEAGQNIYYGEQKGHYYVLAKQIEELDVEEAVLVAAVDSLAFALPKQAEILISSTNKLKINHASHQLPNGRQIFDWVVRSMDYE